MTRCNQQSNAKNLIFTIYKVDDFFVVDDRTKLFDLIRYIPNLFELLDNLINLNFQDPISRSGKSHLLPSAQLRTECHKYDCFLVVHQDGH